MEGGYVEPFGAGSCSEDKGAGGEGIVGAGGELIGGVGVGYVCDAALSDGSTEVEGLLFEVFHHLGS